MNNKVRPLILAGQIVSVVLFILLLIGSATLSYLLNIAGATELATLYGIFIILSIVGVVVSIIGIIAATQHGRAFKKKRWAVICTAVLDIILGVLGLIGSGQASSTPITIVVYLAVLAAGIILIVDLFRASKTLEQEMQAEKYVSGQSVVLSPTPYGPSLEPYPTDATHTPVQNNISEKPLRDKLLEIKTLFDEGLITEQEYTEKRKNILAGEGPK